MNKGLVISAVIVLVVAIIFAIYKLTYAKHETVDVKSAVISLKNPNDKKSNKPVTLSSKIDQIENFIRHGKTRNV